MKEYMKKHMTLYYNFLGLDSTQVHIKTISNIQHRKKDGKTSIIVQYIQSAVIFNV